MLVFLCKFSGVIRQVCLCVPDDRREVVPDGVEVADRKAYTVFASCQSLAVTLRD